MQGKECKLHYEIIASGSSGNCVIIGDMMFDCGVAYNKIRKYLYNIKYVIITHVHCDHLNLTTLEKIRKEFPRIEFIANYDVGQRTFIHHLVGDETILALKDRVIKSFPCIHDVPTHGFVINMRDLNIIYVTDTSNLDHAPSGKYDYLFIESNHCENKIAAIQNNAEQKYGYDAWENAMRHLSTQKSKAFYYINRKNENSKWIELHKSSRFY